MSDSESIFAVLWRRRLSFVLGFIATLAAAALVTFSLPKVYETVTYLWVNPDRQAGNDFEATQISQVLTKTYAELLQTRSLSEEVASRLASDARAEDVAESVDVSAIAESQLLQITALGGTPQQAQRVADTYAQAFVRRSQQLGSAGTTASRVTIAERATLPGRPSRPDPVLYLLVGAAVAVFAGAAFALLRDRLDQRLEVTEATTELLGFPIIGRLPESGRPLRRTGSRRTAESQAGASEAFRLLLANLTFVTLGRAPRSVAVVSPGEREGKSTCALNLARVASETASDVVLVDADLRRPVLESRLGIDTRFTGGLTNFLVGSMSLDQVTVSVPSHLLRLVPSGPLPPNPSALFGTSSWSRFGEAAESAFDLVVYDTPPVSVAADATLISATAEGVVLIVDAKKTRRTPALRAIEQLQRANANILGVIVNRIGATGDYNYYAPSSERVAERLDGNEQPGNGVPPGVPRAGSSAG